MKSFEVSSAPRFRRVHRHHEQLENLITARRKGFLTTPIVIGSDNWLGPDMP
jgi:hypothetical protein